MRNTLIILAGVILFMATPATVYAAGEASSDTAVEGEGQTKEKVRYRYVKFNPIIVPIIADYSVKGYISVTISLQIEDFSDYASIKDQRNNLIDAYTRTLLSYAQIYVDPKSRIVFDHIAQTLQKTTDDFLGEKRTQIIITELAAKPRIS